MISVFGVMVVWPGGWNMTDAELMQREGVPSMREVWKNRSRGCSVVVKEASVKIVLWRRMS